MSFIRSISVRKDRRLSILKDDFYFSVIYQKPDGQKVVLGRSDRIVQPMYSLSDLNYVNGDQTTGNAHIEGYARQDGGHRSR